MKHILTLCIGNICRSPIAEAMLKKEFPDKTVWSAGLGALVGNPADPMSIELAAAHRLDLSEHRAQQLVAWMCQKADLILVMEQSHKLEVEQKYPMTRGKVFGLGSVSKFEIADPYRKPKSAFEAAYAEIAKGVADWAPRIRQLG
jgi:protein-tyrosine phosphatase